MAVSAPTTSRRGLLGGIALASIAALPGAATAAPNVRRRWQIAIERFESIKSERDTFNAEVHDPLYAEAARVFGNRPWLHPDYRRWSKIPAGFVERSNALCEAFADRLDELLEAPAPDLKALAYKLAVLAEHCGAETVTKELLAAIVADAKRVS